MTSSAIIIVTLVVRKEGVESDSKDRMFFVMRTGPMIMMLGSTKYLDQLGYQGKYDVL